MKSEGSLGPKTLVIMKLEAFEPIIQGVEVSL
jgi:hypothetical protein